MTLIVEDGTGIAGAESYVSVAAADVYWANRSHMTLAATWADATQAGKEGALREAATYLDAVYGPYYRGTRLGTSQGLLWPRFGAKDDRGYDLRGPCVELALAATELAVRALSEPLQSDLEQHGTIVERSEVVGPVRETVRFGSQGAVETPRYGVIDRMLHPILNGSQPGAPLGGGWGFR